MASWALVTGGGYGVGRAVAIAMAREGYDVAVLGRSAEALTRTVQRLETVREHASAVAYECDLSDDAAIERAVGSLEELAESRLDVLVHCAFGHIGEDQGQSLEAVELDDLRSFCLASVYGSWALTRAVVPMLRRASGRAIYIGADWGLPMHNVMVASSGDRSDRIGSEAFVSAKHAISGLVTSLELQSRVRATGIYPGVIASARMRASADDRIDDRYFDIDTPLADVWRDGYDSVEAIPLSDVANAVVFAVRTVSTVRTLVLKPSGFDYAGG